jgi:hypothetical protein
MQGELKFESVEAARRDLENRTLAKIKGDFARLIYLASMRDYNTGDYHHEGLARQFNEGPARTALASCHQEVFRRLALCSVKELVEQLEIYVRANVSAFSDFVRVWEKIQPYKVAIPVDCNPLAARSFALNVRVALAILQGRHSRAHQDQRSASPRQ